MAFVFHRRLAIPLWAVAFFTVALTAPPPATLLTAAGRAEGPHRRIRASLPRAAGRFSALLVCIAAQTGTNQRVTL
jgi:hypothetical protein